MSKKYKYEKYFTVNDKRYVVRADTKSELDMKLAKKIYDIENGTKKIDKNMSVSEWFDEWLTTYKESSVSSESLDGYKSRINVHILPAIGSMPLSKVKPIHCQRILNDMTGMSTKMISVVARLMKEAFSKAVKNNLMLSNPAEDLDISKGTKKASRRLTDEEIRCSLELAETHHAGMWIKLMYYCGLRTGEACALRWCDIDFDNNMIHVRHTIKRNGNVLGSPKTASGVRRVPMPDVLVRDLKAYKLSSKYESTLQSYVLRAVKGGPVTDKVKQKWWDSFKNDLNIMMGCDSIKGVALPPYRLAPDIHPHLYRHTYCTNLQDAGVPINVARQLMGHSSIQITSQIYTHETDTSIENARNMINGFTATPTATPSAESVDITG